MKTIRLGKTELEVSRVGIGGIPLTRPSFDEAVKVVRHALDLGINFIDTARGYNDSEDRVGKAIEGRRDQVIIATKGGGQNKASALKSIELSLEHLQTDYIDLWHIHGISNFDEYEKVTRSGGAMDAAKEALRSGKIRHIGMSSHNLDVALKAVSSGLFEAIMFPFNIISNEAADKLVSLAKEHDVGFLAMKSFAGGTLNDAHLAMKYLLQFDNAVPVPGVEKAQDIEQIVNIVNGSWKLTPHDQQRIKEIHTKMSPRFCRQCEICLPCPKGVFIPGVTYLPILYGLWPREWFLSWRYTTNAFNSAKNCDQCGECEKKCPFKLPIREIISENVKFYEKIAKREA